MMDKITGKPLDIISYLMSVEDKNQTYVLQPFKASNPRSLNANNYFYALATKVAERLRISLNEVHNKIIADYGYPEYMDDKIVYFILPDRVDAMKLDGVHLKATSKTQVLDNGEVNRVYIVMRGTHTYNSAEMARVIDGLISEAKQLDIDVISNSEKEKMIEKWGEDYAKHHPNG